MVNARAKGASGEREFCKWISDSLDLEHTPTRNLEQVRSGGADILGVDPFVFEIKRVERVNRKKWWLQVKAAAEPGSIPVVAYRQNRKPWEFLIPASCIGLTYGYIVLEEKEFTAWARLVLGNYEK
jgi:hypothetical protein